MHQCTVKCTSYLYLCLARASATVILSFPCVGITFTPTDDHPCLALNLDMLEYSIAYSTTYLLHYRRAIDVPWALAYLPLINKPRFAAMYCYFRTTSTYRSHARQSGTFVFERRSGQSS